jgi:hypothetical protein
MDRVLLTDTDSLLLSYRRRSKSLFERLESRMGLAASYSRSATCRFHLDLFFKTFADCLDFSSLAKDSFLHGALIANSTCPRAIEVMIS